MKILNRAKSIYSDEYFISKDIKFDLGLMYLRVNNQWRECEESTRSINLDDMLDSQGNKIFASLSEDGKGGDVCINPDYELNKYIFIYNLNSFEFGISLLKDIDTDVDSWEYSPLNDECLELFEIIGIQK